MIEPVDIWEIATARLREAERAHWLACQQQASGDTVASLQALALARMDVNRMLAWVRDLNG